MLVVLVVRVIYQLHVSSRSDPIDRRHSSTSLSSLVLLIVSQAAFSSLLEFCVSNDDNQSKRILNLSCVYYHIVTFFLLFLPLSLLIVSLGLCNISQKKLTVIYFETH